MIAAGDEAPDFTLPDEAGTPRHLTDLLSDGPVVLFFYPKANSGGCTREACHFRDLAGEFAAAGAQRVGISRDSVDQQQKFAQRNSFGYPLLSDRDGAVARAYGVGRGLLSVTLPSKRATFVIGRDRRVMAAFSSEMDMNVHADRALKALRATTEPAVS